MDNIPEREQPKQERIIHLGEKFQPFDPKYTNQRISQMGVNVCDSSILLNVKDALHIPLNIGAYSSGVSKGACITPFDPEIGYRIDSEDLKLDSRLRKMERLKNELKETIDFSKAPVFLQIEAYNTALNKLGLNEKDEVMYKFSEEMLALLSRLRVLLSFPEGLYEARPWKTKLGFGELDFNFFIQLTPDLFLLNLMIPLVLSKAFIFFYHPTQRNLLKFEQDLCWRRSNQRRHRRDLQ